MPVMLLRLDPAVASERTANQPAKALQSAKVLQFERTRIELGPISDDVVRTELFHFTNTSDRPVQVVIGGCHFCGVPTSDKPVYQPGEKGVIFVEVNSAGRKGTMRAGGTVSVLGLEGSHVDVEVLAEVRPRVWSEPEGVTIVGVPRGASFRSSFKLCGRSPAFAVLGANSESEYITASLGEVESIDDAGDPRRCVPIVLSIAPSTPIGSHEVRISCTTSDAKEPVRTVSCSLEVVGELRAIPEQQSLGAIAPGAGFVGHVNIESRLGAPVRLVEIAIADRGLFQDLALDWTYTPSGVQVSLTGRAPLRALQWTQATVAIRSIAPDGIEETLLVPFGASVRVQP